MKTHKMSVDELIKRIIAGMRKMQIQHRPTVNGMTLMR